jgi:carboxymethylenebutenolidase
MEVRMLIALAIVVLLGAVAFTDLFRVKTAAVQAPSRPGTTVEIRSGDKIYPSYLATAAGAGRNPAIVLVHSINGLEPGYRDLADQLATEGYVVLAPQWQTFERTPSDAVLEQLLKDALAYLRTRTDVNPERIGLMGFCIGGRYTMLYLPLINDFRSGVAFYGFPYRGGTETQPQSPADLIGQLQVPLLIIHGTADQPSPISDIYNYATALDAAGKYFELKVYQGQPHGFLLQSGQLSESFAAQDAYREMVTFFQRTLR